MSGYRDPYVGSGGNNAPFSYRNYQDDDGGYNPYATNVTGAQGGAGAGASGSGQAHDYAYGDSYGGNNYGQNYGQGYGQGYGPTYGAGYGGYDPNAPTNMNVGNAAEPSAESDAPPVPSKNVLTKGGSLSRRGTTNSVLTRAPPSGPPKRDSLRHSFTPGTQPMSRGRTTDIKGWRMDHHGDRWTRGGRVRCCGRFCCCFLWIFLLLLVSIILTLILWIQPPIVAFEGVQTSTNGSTFEATTNSEFKINLGFGIFVRNPNYFSANFKEIDVNIFYPINNTNVGGGTEKDITFDANSDKNFTFPFSFTYSKAIDPNGAILSDLVNKCGLIPGSSKSNIEIAYKLTLHIKVIVATISPSFSGNADFECPLSLDQVEPFLNGLGINIPGLTGSGSS